MSYNLTSIKHPHVKASLLQDRIGKTLLSHAIEANNYDLVKVLVDNGANVAGIRVRENEVTDVTVPLYQKALRRDLDVNIVKLLQTVLPDDLEHEEKDQVGWKH